MRSSPPVMRSIARFVLVLLALAVPARASEEMPEGFVYLRDVDPTILQDMRYAGPSNFTGVPWLATVPPNACWCVLQPKRSSGCKMLSRRAGSR